MTDIAEGPAVSWRDDDEVTLDQCPFAYRLQRALSKLGVAVQSYRPMKVGEPIRADGYTQLHLKKDNPEGLAEEIKGRFGINVQFAELAIPPNGVQCVTWQKAGEVWVRHIVAYLPQDDSTRQRWDVLVKAIS